MVLMMAIVAPFLMLFGIPVWLILVIISFISLVFFIDMPLSIMPQTMFGSLNEFALMAIPLFILAGYLMGSGSIAVRLINWTKSLTGNLPGGTAITTVGVNTVFGVISGSAPAVTATLGKILFPELRKEGYSSQFSAGLLAGMGALDSVIPPSINMILFAATANVSVAQLFLAGFVPSVIIAFLIGGYCYLYGRIAKPTPADPSQLPAKPPKLFEAPLARLKIIGRETRGASLALGVPFIIFSGIYSGIATPTEVAAIACLYALVVSTLLYREMTGRALVDAVKQAAYVSAQIFIIMAAAGLFAWVLVIGQVPQDLVAFIESLGWPWWMVLLLINVLLLVIGMFMDPVSAIVILTPLLKPLALSIGLDPIHFGTIMVVNLAIGLFTPPFGLNLFVVMSVCKVPMAQIVRGLLPLLALYLIGLMLVSYIPALSLWLPTLVYR